MHIQNYVNEALTIMNGQAGAQVTPESAALLMICQRLDALESTLSEVVTELRLGPVNR